MERMNKDKMICLDIETTGLAYMDGDEILQLAIVDGNGNTLFNHYFKPEHLKEWKQAESVNHISPAMVANEKPLSYYQHEIENIFYNAENVVSYNGEGFDLPFIEAQGINTYNSKYKTHYDVMLNFAPVWNVWDEVHQDFRWAKLEECYTYFGYETTDKMHDALADAKATLYCYYKMRKYETEHPNLDKIHKGFHL